MIDSEVVDGLAVLIRRTGDERPRPILLVHGAMDRAASFRRTMRRIDAATVLAHDRRGYAGSIGAGAPGSIDAHAEDLSRLIDHLAADEVVVVGHSLGGTIALAAALRDPRIASVGAFESPAPWLDEARDGIGGGAVELARTDGPAAGAEHFYRRMVGDATWDRLRSSDRAARRAEGPALVAELEDLRRPDMRVALDELRCPVLVGAGEQSGERFRSGAQRLVEQLPDARLTVIAGAGHGAHLTHPDEFARFVASAREADRTRGTPRLRFDDGLTA